MRSSLIIASFVLAACGPSKQRRCERYAKDGLGLVMGLANGVAKGLGGDAVEPVELTRADRDKATVKIIEECMTWPDDFVVCMTDGDWDSVQCREAYARKEGLVVQVDGAAGPPPTRRELGRDDFLVSTRDHSFIDVGAALNSTTQASTRVADGELVGVTEVGGRTFVIATKDGEVSLATAAGDTASLATAAAGDTASLAMDSTTKVAAPRPAPDDPLAVPLAVSAKGLVLFDDGRVRRLVPPPCEPCFEETPWRIEGQPSAYDFPELHEVKGGIVYYNRDQRRLTVLGDDGALRFALSGTPTLGEPLVLGDQVYLTVGAEAVGLDLAQCRSDHRLSLDELAAPCLVARTTLSAADESRPQRLGERVFFLADGRVHALAGGKKQWVAEVEADSFIAVERGAATMLFAATRWTMDHPARLVALDPDNGMTRMQIDIDAGGSFASFDLARDGEWLVMQVSHSLFSWRLDALAAALAEL